MEILHNLMDGFATLVGSGLPGVAWWEPGVVVVGGIIIGIFVGVMPGLSASTGVALMVPFTYGMHPLIALILLAAVYTASAYGGCITAISINTPGTPAAVALVFDGYALTKRGEPGRALGTALIANCTGGVLGIFILIAFSVPLAKAALAFGPPEYFALAVFGLTIVVSMASKNMLKGAVSTVLGLLLMTIGLDPITGFMRYTFDRPQLIDGISFIPALIGLFAVGEVLLNIERYEPVKAALQSFSSKMPGRKEVLGLKRSILQSSVLGTIIGVVPGAGATIAAFIAYNEARRVSKRPEEFGKGSLEGIAAPAAAAGGSVGGALVPLLTLGIPGSAATAVLIGALMLHGVTPGPELFAGKNSYLVYGLFASLVLGNFVLLALGVLGNRLWVKIISAPKALLYPVILVIAFVGSFGVANSMFDVLVCLIFGVLGWILRRYGFPTAPLVLALILGYMAESGFRRALIMGDPSIFFTRPVSAAILLLAVLSFAMPFIRWRAAKRKMEVEPMSTLFKQTKELTAQIDDFLDAISEGALVFQKGVADYLSGDLERFEQRYVAIETLENHADDVRRAVESQLYRYSLIPESRGDVLDLLETMDDVINTAKNTMSLFLVERPEMIPELTEEWIDLAEAAARTSEAVVLAARAFFRDPRSVNDHLHKVHFHEKEGDRIAMDLKRKIFETDVDLSRKIHLRYFALNIDRVSDAAEDVADRLSIYAIKRTV